MNGAIFSIRFVWLFWWLFKSLLIAWLSLKFIWIFVIFIFRLLLYLHIVLFECFFIRWWSFKWNFWLTIYIILSSSFAWTGLKILIMFWLETWFVAAFTLKFCFTRFILICWLFLHSNRFGFITVFIRCIWIKWNMWFIFHVRLRSV